MSQRVLGFILVSVAIVGSFLAVTLSNYIPGIGIAWNLQNAYVLREQVQCSPPSLSGLNPVINPPECPLFRAGYDALPIWGIGPGSARYAVIRPGLKLGYALAGTAALALGGVGLLLFGKSSK